MPKCDFNKVALQRSAQLKQTKRLKVHFSFILINVKNNNHVEGNKSFDFEKYGFLQKTLFFYKVLYFYYRFPPDNCFFPLRYCYGITIELGHHANFPLQAINLLRWHIRGKTLFKNVPESIQGMGGLKISGFTWSRTHKIMVLHDIMVLHYFKSQCYKQLFFKILEFFQLKNEVQLIFDQCST